MKHGWGGWCRGAYSAAVMAGQAQGLGIRGGREPLSNKHLSARLWLAQWLLSLHTPMLLHMSPKIYLSKGLPTLRFGQFQFGKAWASGTARQVLTVCPERSWPATPLHKDSFCCRYTSLACAGQTRSDTTHAQSVGQHLPSKQQAAALGISPRFCSGKTLLAPTDICATQARPSKKSPPLSLGDQDPGGCPWSQGQSHGAGLAGRLLGPRIQCR